ncbi:MAG: D-aminoacyl-tRNA deacylase [Kiritimatiellaeota bacterium]|nr:D-aminoacyl-tRNA deacylase [Kiritimatiellota bacterium]
MKLVIQRVRRAVVRLGRDAIGAIGPGALILTGVATDSTLFDVRYLARKVSALRIFDDEQGRLNRSLRDVGGAVLVVSQFTLYGDAAHGNRPGYTDAAPPDRAQALLEEFIAALRALGHDVQTGRFGAAMQVELENDGPVTLILESRGRPQD